MLCHEATAFGIQAAFAYFILLYRFKGGLDFKLRITTLEVQSAAKI